MINNFARVNIFPKLDAHQLPIETQQIILHLFSALTQSRMQTVDDDPNHESVLQNQIRIVIHRQHRFDKHLD